MRRPTLFPPPGTVETLPENVEREARRLLAELIIAVLVKTTENSQNDKDHHHE